MQNHHKAEKHDRSIKIKANLPNKKRNISADEQGSKAVCKPALLFYLRRARALGLMPRNQRKSQAFARYRCSSTHHIPPQRAQKKGVYSPPCTRRSCCEPHLPPWLHRASLVSAKGARTKAALRSFLGLSARWALLVLLCPTPPRG